MISVIIPVYNAEPCLRRCLDSVLASACGDFEIVLINDGSTDGSLKICTEYATGDRRIRLITQENQGVSAARNRGIDEALGEWLIFLDADDFITDDFLSMTARPEYRQTNSFCSGSPPVPPMRPPGTAVRKLQKTAATFLYTVIRGKKCAG